MATERYEHKTGEADGTFCVHCGVRREDWDKGVCALKTPETARLDRLTMRDQFAMAALTGVLVENLANANVDAVARAAYQYADAMMEARDA